MMTKLMIMFWLGFFEVRVRTVIKLRLLRCLCSNEDNNKMNNGDNNKGTK